MLLRRRIDQREALFAARYQHGADATARDDMARGRDNFGIVADRHLACRMQFATVGREHGGAAIAREVDPLGIDKDGNGMGAPGRHRRIDNRLRQHALAIVGQDNGLRAWRFGLQ